MLQKNLVSTFYLNTEKFDFNFSKEESITFAYSLALDCQCPRTSDHSHKSEPPIMIAL